MSAIYLTLFIAFIFAAIALVFLILTVKTGQLEDVEAPKYRMFFESDEKEGK